MPFPSFISEHLTEYIHYNVSNFEELHLFQVLYSTEYIICATSNSTE